MTDDIKSAVEAAREYLTRSFTEGNATYFARAYLTLASRVEKIEAETVERCAEVADQKYAEGCGCYCVAAGIRNLSQPKE
jgi:hypothetical protein